MNNYIAMQNLTASVKNDHCTIISTILSIRAFLGPGARRDCGVSSICRLSHFSYLREKIFTKQLVMREVRKQGGQEGKGMCVCVCERERERERERGWLEGGMKEKERRNKEMYYFTYPHLSARSLLNTNSIFPRAFLLSLSSFPYPLPYISLTSFFLSSSCSRLRAMKLTPYSVSGLVVKTLSGGGGGGEGVRW